MKRNEKQRKFHDSLINMLYAPPSPPSQHTQFDDQTLDFAREIVNSDSHPINTDVLEEQDERSLSSSSDEHGELGFQKLTRAQRKRLRRKKLKEAASHRRKIIGPQLLIDDRIDERLEGVRRNAAERPDGGNELNDHNHSGETSSCIKVNHRRMSKKNTRAKTKTPPTDFSHGSTDHGTQD